MDKPIAWIPVCMCLQVHTYRFGLCLRERSALFLFCLFLQTCLNASPGITLKEFQCQELHQNSLDVRNCYYFEQGKILAVLGHSLFAKLNFNLGISPAVEMLVKMPKIKQVG